MKRNKLFAILFMIMTITSIIKANEVDFIETVEGYVRTGYQYTDIKNEDSYADLSLGGKLHIETAAWQHLNAGLSIYTTNAILSKNEGNGIPFFDAENISYTLIGEAYLKGEWEHSMLKIGRQEIDTPFADTDDIGMIPNTFEAAVLVNKNIPDTTLFFAHLDKMAGVDAEQPSSFTKINGSEGVQIAGLTYEGIENLTFSGWFYRLNDHEIDQIVYTEAIYENKMGDFNYLFGFQYAYQSYHTQADAKVYGLQGEIAHEMTGISFGVSFNKNINNAIFNGFGGGPFFTSAEHLTLAEAGTDGEAKLVYASWNAKNIGLSPLTFGLGHLILENNNAQKSKELDVTVHYEYNDTISFNLLYSDIKDEINGGAFQNVRVFANYSF